MTDRLEQYIRELPPTVQDIVRRVIADEIKIARADEATAFINAVRRGEDIDAYYYQRVSELDRRRK